MKGKGHGLASVGHKGIGVCEFGRGKGSYIISHCSPAAKFSDLYEALSARCDSSTGLIWPAGQRLSTPDLNSYNIKGTLLLLLKSQMLQKHCVGSLTMPICGLTNRVLGRRMPNFWMSLRFKWEREMLNYSKAVLA